MNAAGPVLRDACLRTLSALGSSVLDLSHEIAVAREPAPADVNPANLLRGSTGEIVRRAEEVLRLAEAADVLAEAAQDADRRES